ncbi:DUF1801 domain-containing protein [Vibrio sp. SCSIO 43136]|uniref:DUF1801 domain-containing protein n=1 Tax=Vibrio sp. SCSIO 43136 TaxID=2819101 RepID=UPI00207584F9|nr:DUF1801 domain-containing protein [Vibrio sp. SCSIO 43136]USD66421.1 DUF1801 domain-containing protein [Vibrio sp. SCSIO 43136]
MNEAVSKLWSGYPQEAKNYLSTLRKLIHEVAHQLQLEAVEESLKWGEASYLAKTGSPIRIDWKLKTPAHCYLYFNCQTKLVDTFRELYGDLLVFQGNRAIVLPLSESLPEKQLRHCIELTLTYQQRKNLPLLGAC